MPNLPIIESYWVEENRFLAGEYPGGFDPESTRLRLDAFFESGVNAFIDLTQPHELAPYKKILEEQAQLNGIKTSYHHFGIRDHDVPSHETMAAILAAIDDLLNGGRNLYVHCWGGVGRTGLVVGCHLVRHGSTNQQAISLVNNLYRTRPKNPFYPNSPETRQQIDFVLNWRED